jgi:thioredoxin 1
MTVSLVKDKKMDKRVLRFTATWCGPCKMLAKNLEEVNTQVPIEVVDIDVNQETAIDYGVRGVPTLIMLEGNNEIKRLVGMQPLKALEEWLND